MLGAQYSSNARLLIEIYSKKKPPDKAVVLKVALAGFYKALRKLN
tara:strand:+ start:229 stop:363 length:135 start_codon:yes stop_codon:yes gene_type:complete